MADMTIVVQLAFSSGRIPKANCNAGAKLEHNSHWTQCSLIVTKQCTWMQGLVVFTLI